MQCDIYMAVDLYDYSFLTYLSEELLLYVPSLDLFLKVHNKVLLPY